MAAWRLKSGLAGTGKLSHLEKSEWGKPFKNCWSRYLWVRSPTCCSEACSVTNSTDMNSCNILKQQPGGVLNRLNLLAHVSLGKWWWINSYTPCVLTAWQWLCLCCVTVYAAQSASPKCWLYDPPRNHPPPDSGLWWVYSSHPPATVLPPRVHLHPLDGWTEVRGKTLNSSASHLFSPLPVHHLGHLDTFRKYTKGVVCLFVKI